MSRRTKTDEEEEKINTVGKRKKAYQSPRLVVYGDLSQVTRGGGGRKNDPSTHNRTRA